MQSVTIGRYLWQRLRQLNVKYVFGVPGDFNLQLLEQLDEVDGIEFVGTCNELNAAYAADGYARTNGIAALLTTYGVGDLSALCGVAGSLAEHIPVVMISGVPPMFAIRNRLRIHHTMAEGDFDNVRNAVRQFTLTEARLTPSNASQEIDRALRYCWQERCPVYLQIPSNLSYLEIAQASSPLTRQYASYDKRQHQLIIGKLTGRLCQAKHPLLLVDMDAERSQMAIQLQQLCDRYQIPYASFSTGKAILDESSPLWLGYYPGQTDDTLNQYLAKADFILATAPCYIEGSSMVATQDLPVEETIYLRGFDITFEQQTFEGICAPVLLNQLLEQSIECQFDIPKQPPQTRSSTSFEGPLQQSKLWEQLRHYFKAGDLILGENGSANIALQTVPFPKDCHYLSQPIWGSIGYTLPALLGSMMAAPNKRHWLFIGDGSLQMTVQELSNILQKGLKPIIVMLNNSGYTIERYIMGKSATYNDIPQWDYHLLLKAFAPDIEFTYQNVTTHQQLSEVLDALDETKASFIELKLSAMDAPERLKQFGPSVALFDYGPRGPQNK
ncbi:alpha-keto acid decarboxylase family protein [Celerinatantimonas diazotrophica]|uniref:Indolepyruvate decarboxylase n=1 Tax=Celerinatantimonas diazotrophica TaxID=412034 RepID=A0A4R1JAV3_9GAMM|nr:thiamine pyrophosphate-binding protein [Celerinatantimonas diazotrophica]TCK47229.1 indolepyruvate decarboxylase [Celerinatantimonas diazotrophica]CAG9296001.1 Alpha-keto-acid decarboxylase [Celerinatantimonas diazotrophica]